jgi:hypothetical protein
VAMTLPEEAPIRDAEDEALEHGPGAYLGSPIVASARAVDTSTATGKNPQFDATGVSSIGAQAPGSPLRVIAVGPRQAVLSSPTRLSRFSPTGSANGNLGASSPLRPLASRSGSSDAISATGSMTPKLASAAVS